MTRVENEETWMLAGAIANEYMKNGGEKKAKTRFTKMVRSGKNLLELIPESIRGYVEYNIAGMKERESEYLRNVRTELSTEIRELCMDRTIVYTKKSWNKLIEDRGGMKNVFNKACRNAEKSFNPIPNIYADAIILAYRHDAEKEVFALLVKLPKKLIAQINDILSDTQEYMICVDDGNLVVHDN